MKRVVFVLGITVGCAPHGPKATDTTAVQATMRAAEPLAVIEGTPFEPTAELVTGFALGSSLAQVRTVCERLGGWFDERAPARCTVVADRSVNAYGLLLLRSDRLLNVAIMVRPPSHAWFSKQLALLQTILGFLDEGERHWTWSGSTRVFADTDSEYCVISYDIGETAIGYEKYASSWRSMRSSRTWDVSNCLSACTELAGGALHHCDHDACRYLTVQSCVHEKCDIICQNQHAPLGVRMWCDDGGIGKQWCRQYCSHVSDLRAMWCDGAAPERAACIAHVTSMGESCRQTCR